MPKIIPFGDRIMVKRRKIGDKLGSGILYSPDETKERSTDIADVVYVAELTFADKAILNNAESIIEKLVKEAAEGNKDSIEALHKLNDFIKRKSIKVGDAVFVSKYVGLDFVEFDKGVPNDLTLLNSEDVIGLIVKENIDA